MPSDEIHLGDVGTIIQATIKDGASIVDVSAATTKSIIFKKPNGVKVTKAASFVTDGTDGKIEYTIVAGDFNVDGKWYIQGKIISTGTWSSSIDDFYVHPNL